VLLHEALDHSPDFTRVVPPPSSVPDPAAAAATAAVRAAAAATAAVRAAAAATAAVRAAAAARAGGAAGGPPAPAAPGARTVELWSRDALARYALCCCQAPRGGLRDKPGKPPDAYHSCYVLAGLAGAQHEYGYRPRAGRPCGPGAGGYGGDGEEGEDDGGRAGASLTAAFNWTVTGTKDGCWTVDDVVEPVHPIFVIAMDKVEAVRVKYPRNQTGFRTLVA
jgi:hypothetical protein